MDEEIVGLRGIVFKGQVGGSRLAKLDILLR
jgi:hypothetical protein